MHLNKNKANVGDLQVYVGRNMGLLCISADATQDAIELTQEQVIQLKDYLNKLDISQVTKENDL